MGTTTVTHDVTLTAVVIGFLALGWLVVHVSREAARALEPSRPRLPEEDCPPAGLGRLVPVGAQVEQECRRGLVTLELWLASHRRGTGPSPAHVPRPRSPLPARRRRMRRAG